MQYTSTNHLYLKHISCFLPPASCFTSLEAYLLPPFSFLLPRNYFFLVNKNAPR